MAGVIRKMMVILGSGGDGEDNVIDLARWAQAEQDVQPTAVVLGTPDREGADSFESDPLWSGVRRAPAPVDAARSVADSVGRPHAGRRIERVWLRRALADAGRFDLIVASSTDAVIALDHLPVPTVGDPSVPPVVAVLPLLDEGWGSRLSAPALARRLTDAALTVVPVAAVADWACRTPGKGGLGLDRSKVAVHHGPIAPPRAHRRQRDADSVLVVGCGPVGWRAGTDLFLSLASEVGASVDGRGVRWVWIGDDDPDGTGSDVRADLAGRAAQDGEVVVKIVPDGADRADRLAVADLLVSTWREGPYPVSLVQAALAGTPVVGLTPGTELLTEAGHEDLRVPRLDVRALAAAAVDLIRDQDRGRLLAGDLARAAADATTPLAAARVWSDIEDAVARARGRRS